MAPLPEIANVYRCSIDWVGAGGLTAASVFHVRTTVLDESEIATAISDLGDLDMMVTSGPTTNGTSISITKLDGESGTQIFAAPVWASGAGSGDLVAQGAAIVSFQTALRGPRHRGRIYLPFVGEGSQANGTLNGGDVGVSQDAWNAFIVAMAGVECPLVVASYVHAEATLVTGCVVRSVIGTQRRRAQRLNA